MRSALARGALALTSMVALAFLIPLAFVAATVARDRAIVDAGHQAGAIVAALAVSDQPDVLAQAMAATPAGAEGLLAVHLPGQPALGIPRAASADVALAAARSQSITASAPSGLAYLQATALDSGHTAVIEVYIPDSELQRGVAGAWISMAVVAVLLVAGSVVVADRLGARTVSAARRLAEAARAFGGDDLRVRVVPDGPREIAEAGQAFNVMADRMVAFVDGERQLAGDLSHRLRTPLTALRLDAETMPAGPVGDRMRQAVAALESEIESIIAGAGSPVVQRSEERTDVVDVLADRMAFWAVLAEDHGREWTVTGAETPLWTRAPRSDLIAAVDALLGNVFEHTPQGSPFAIHIGEDALVVEDGGEGIGDPALALRRGASGSGSTGVGLDIVRRVSESCGGAVSIDRSQLGGARITMTLR